MKKIRMANPVNKGFFLKLLSFAKTALLHPRSIGAVVPSSPYLAKSMAECINHKKPGFVLELGPGTGAITEAILKSGISPKKLIAVELSKEFIATLKKTFPDIQIISGNAVHLSALIQNFKPIHTIISSLPLRNFSKEDCDAILNEIPKTLAPGGQFIQFSYAIKGEVYHPENMELTKSFVIWKNLPPARVSVFQNKPG